MSKTQIEHVKYTRDELTTYPYYVDVINYLKNENIISYIDIGANVGEFCNVLFEQIPTLKTAHLIEPEINNFNFMQNNVHNKDVKFYNLAIGYGFESPILIPDIHGNVGGYKLVEGQQTSDLTPTQTLESLNLPIVDLVKIDIEGCEFNLIENSSFLQKNKFIEIEFHITLEEINTNFIQKYVDRYFPNYEIAIYYHTRCLLKKNKING